MLAISSTYAQIYTIEALELSKHNAFPGFDEAKLVSKVNVLRWLLVVLRRQSPSLPSNNSVKTQELDLGSCKLFDLDVMQRFFF